MSTLPRLVRNPRRARAERRCALAAIEEYLDANGPPHEGAVLVAQVHDRHVTISTLDRLATEAAARVQRIAAPVLRALRPPSPGAVRVLVIGRYIIDAGEARRAWRINAPGGRA